MSPPEPPLFPERQKVSPQSPFEMIQQSETVMGLFLAAGMGAIVLVTAPQVLWILYDKGRLPGAIALGLAMLVPVLAVFQYRTIKALRAAIESDQHPVPLHFANRQLRIHLAIRPFATVWWIYQTAIILFASALLSRAVETHRSAQDSQFDQLTAIWLQILLFFAFAVSSNAYLLSAVASLTGSATLTRLVWRWRFALDLIVVIAVHRFSGFDRMFGLSKLS